MLRSTTGPSFIAMTTCLLMAATGCGDDGGGNGALGGSGGAAGGSGGAAGGSTAGTGGSGGATAPGIKIDGSAGLMPGGSGYVTDGDVCFVSDGAADICAPFMFHGAYAIVGVPVNTTGAVRFRGPQIATYYWVLTTGSEDINLGISIDTPAVIQGYYDQTGITPTADGVVLQAEYYPVPTPGWQAVITPASGEGPFYEDGYLSQHLDLDATGTTAASALAVFLNVDRSAGPFSASFTADADTCTTPSWGGPQPSFAIPEDADVVWWSLSCP